MVILNLLFIKWASSVHWPSNDYGQYAEQRLLDKGCLTKILISSASITSEDPRVNLEYKLLHMSLPGKNV